MNIYFLLLYQISSTITVFETTTEKLEDIGEEIRKHHKNVKVARGVGVVDDVVDSSVAAGGLIGLFGGCPGTCNCFWIES